MKFQKRILLVSLLVTLSPFAAAEGYIGGAFGSTDVDEPGYDNSDTYKIYGGYRAGNLGLEGAYINFDGFDVQGTGGAQYVDGDGLEISLIGFLPLGESVELFGKLGMLAWSLDANSYGYNFGSDDGNSFAYGAGLQFKATQQVSLRLEYQGFQDVSGSDLNALTFGAAYHF